MSLTVTKLRLSRNTLEAGIHRVADLSSGAKWVNGSRGFSSRGRPYALVLFGSVAQDTADAQRGRRPVPSADTKIRKHAKGVIGRYIFRGL